MKDLEAFLQGEEEEPLSPEDLEAVRRGLGEVCAGRYVTLEDYDQGKRP